MLEGQGAAVVRVLAPLPPRVCWPIAAARGTPLPSGQNTLLLPQGADVGDVDPAAQKYPPGQGAVHRAEAAPVLLP
jgi:hypothetical protein